MGVLYNMVVESNGADVEDFQGEEFGRYEPQRAGGVCRSCRNWEQHEICNGSRWTSGTPKRFGSSCLRFKDGASVS